MLSSVIPFMEEYIDLVTRQLNLLLFYKESVQNVLCILDLFLSVYHHLFFRFK